MPFYSNEKLKKQELVPGVQIKTIWGDKAMMVFITLNEGAEVPSHRHRNEQMGLVLEGQLDLTIADEVRTVKKGDSYLIPSNIEHRAVATSGKTTALDIFSPPREDFIKLMQQ